MQPVILRPQWLPTNEAAEALGIHRRTLVRRARRGEVSTRTSADGAVLYAVPEGAAPASATRARPQGATRAPQGETPPPAILLEALSEALVRAGRAEAERDAARAELERIRQTAAEAAADLEAERAAHARTLEAARDLEARHVKRGTILRRVAARLAQAPSPSAP